MTDLLIKLTLVGIVFFGVLNLAGLHTWIERKQSAIMQDRIGANRASIFGIRILGLELHPGDRRDDWIQPHAQLTRARDRAHAASKA